MRILIHSGLCVGESYAPKRSVNHYQYIPIACRGITSFMSAKLAQDIRRLMYDSRKQLARYYGAREKRQIKKALSQINSALKRLKSEKQRAVDRRRALGVFIYEDAFPRDFISLWRKPRYTYWLAGDLSNPVAILSSSYSAYEIKILYKRIQKEVKFQYRVLYSDQKEKIYAAQYTDLKDASDDLETAYSNLKLAALKAVAGIEAMPWQSHREIREASPNISEMDHEIERLEKLERYLKSALTEFDDKKQKLKSRIEKIKKKLASLNIEQHICMCLLRKLGGEFGDLQSEIIQQPCITLYEYGKQRPSKECTKGICGIRVRELKNLAHAWDRGSVDGKHSSDFMPQHSVSIISGSKDATWQFFLLQDLFAAASWPIVFAEELCACLRGLPYAVTFFGAISMDNTSVGSGKLLIKKVFKLPEDNLVSGMRKKSAHGQKRESMFEPSIVKFGTGRETFTEPRLLMNVWNYFPQDYMFGRLHLLAWLEGCVAADKKNICYHDCCDMSGKGVIIFCKDEMATAAQKITEIITFLFQKQVSLSAPSVKLLYMMHLENPIITAVSHNLVLYIEKKYAVRGVMDTTPRMIPLARYINHERSGYFSYGSIVYLSHDENVWREISCKPKGDIHLLIAITRLLGSFSIQTDPICSIRIAMLMSEILYTIIVNRANKIECLIGCNTIDLY